MTHSPSAESASPQAIKMGIAAVALVLCVMISIVAIINGWMMLAGGAALLAVTFHLLLWRMLNRAHREREAAEQNAVEHS